MKMMRKYIKINKHKNVKPYLRISVLGLAALEFLSQVTSTEFNASVYRNANLDHGLKLS